MSIYPSPDKLDSQESKYALVILAAKRARQIKDGARRLLPTQSANPLTVALEEIGEGQIIAREVEDAAVAAHEAALKPNVPTLEDIIGAGPVIAEVDIDSTAAQIAALRAAEPESIDEDDDILGGDDHEDDIRPMDAMPLDDPSQLMVELSDNNELVPMDEDDDQ
jgi:DNA-directed RNA polymerase subunit omega